MTRSGEQTMGKFTLWLLGLVQTGIFAMLTIMFTDIDALEDADAAQKQYNTETYARRDDVSKDVDRILKAIERVSDKVDSLKQ